MGVALPLFVRFLSLFLSVFFLFIVVFPAAALTPNSTIEEVMAQQKVPGWYIQFQYTTEYIWGWNDASDRFLGRKNYWALYYLGVEKPASIQSEFYPRQQGEFICPTRPNRLRIYLKDGTELDAIGRNYGFSVGDGFGGVFDSYTELSGSDPLYPHTIKCFTVRLIKLHEIKCEDFIGCVAGKFSKKFPFDIFSNLPSDEITCPAIKIELIGESRSFDLCWLYEGMRPLKYAVAMSLLIKFFVHS